MRQLKHDHRRVHVRDCRAREHGASGRRLDHRRPAEGVGPEAWSPEGRAPYHADVPEAWSPEGRRTAGDTDACEGI